MIALFGWLAAIAGAVIVYLDARPRARRSARGVPPRHIIFRALGWLLLAASFAALLSHYGSATAVFILLFVIMLTWSLVPLASAWASRRAGDD